MWALGYDGGRSELYKALADSFLVAHVRPARPASGSCRPAQGDEGFIVTWVGTGSSSIASYDVQVSINGGPWRTWLLEDEGDVRRLARRARAMGYAFRVRARDASRQRRAPGTSRRRGAPRRRSGSAGSGACVARRARLPGAARHVAARLGTIDGGTIVAITRGPVTRRRLHLVRGHPADPRVDARSRSWSAACGSPSARASTHARRAVRAPNSTTGRRRDPAARLRRRAAPRPRSARGRGRSPPAPSRPTATAPRTASGCAGRTRGGWTRSSCACWRLDGRLVGTRTIRARSAGGQAWTGTGRSAAGACRTGATPAARRAAGGPDVPRAVGATRRRGPGRPLRRHASTPCARPSPRPRRTNQVISPERRRHARLDPPVARGDGRRRALDRRRSPPRPAPPSGRRRRPARPSRYTWRGTDDARPRASPDGRVPVTLVAARRRGQRGAADRHDRPSTRPPPAVAPAATPARSRPTATRRRHDRSCPGRRRARQRQRRSCSRDRRLIRSWKAAHVAAWKATWNGTRADGRASATGRTRSGST